MLWEMALCAKRIYGLVLLRGAQAWFFVETRQTLGGRQELLELLFALYFQQKLWLALSLTAVQAVNFVPVSLPTFSAVASHRTTLAGAI